MIDKNKLKGAIISKGYTIDSFSQAMGMSRTAFYRRLRRGWFGTDEVQSMMKKLDIADPTPIFFADEVTCEVTV